VISGIREVALQIAKQKSGIRILPEGLVLEMGRVDRHGPGREMDIESDVNITLRRSRAL
jgi:hypothetical protein